MGDEINRVQVEKEEAPEARHDIDEGTVAGTRNFRSFMKICFSHDLYVTGNTIHVQGGAGKREKKERRSADARGHSNGK